ncbi:MAG: sigma-70 family RNA polymerase sigma factor [Verrucomicrobia bacterium]|nr:sigma-70 family RNA polymerase sigma factor [Verrucomicrobiota bacterium]
MNRTASPKAGTPALNSSHCSTSDRSPHVGWPCGEKLLKQLDPILRGLSARLAGADLHLREDFFQEGAVAVLTALERFDATKGCAEHFCARYVRGSLLNYRRSLRSLRREIYIGSFSESDAQEANGDTTLSLQLEAREAAMATPAFDAMDCRLVWEAAVAVLTPNELRAVELVHFEGWRANEAAVAMRVSAPRVTQLISSAILKLRARLVAN